MGHKWPGHRWSQYPWINTLLAMWTMKYNSIDTTALHIPAMALRSSCWTSSSLFTGLLSMLRKNRDVMEGKLCFELFMYLSRMASAWTSNWDACWRSSRGTLNIRFKSFYEVTGIWNSCSFELCIKILTLCTRKFFSY